MLHFIAGKSMTWEQWEHLFNGEPPGSDDGGSDMPGNDLLDSKSYEEMTFRKHDTNR